VEPAGTGTLAGLVGEPAAPSVGNFVDVGTEVEDSPVAEVCGGLEACTTGEAVIEDIVVPPGDRMVVDEGDKAANCADPLEGEKAASASGDCLSTVANGTAAATPGWGVSPD
jgi:hypothetical protein